jgi:hypothetical protein
VKILLLFPVIFFAGCAGGPPPPVWQSNAKYSLDSFQQAYLRGDTRVAEVEFARAKEELSSTGNPALVARAELVRCAARAASLEFDNCPAFEKLRADAGAEELAYADFLSGKADKAATEDPLSRLVSHGVKFNSGKAGPENIAAAIDISSAQGWRRPLMAWLLVQQKRAEAAGNADIAARIQRRLDLINQGR